MMLLALTWGRPAWPSILAAAFKNSVRKGRDFTWRTLSSSCGSYRADVIICPFGIIQSKITLHPANQPPVRNICPWCNRKKSLEASHTRVAHSPTLHDTKSHQDLYVCVFMFLSVFLFACACYWRDSDIERLLNCTCQKFSQDDPLPPFINAGLSCQLIYVSQSDSHTIKHKPLMHFCIACDWPSIGYATQCFLVPLFPSLLT